MSIKKEGIGKEQSTARIWIKLINTFFVLKKIAEDKFIRNNAVFFVGSMVAAVLNYLYHPIMSRMMSVENFGEVQVLISLFMQLSIFFGIFGMVTINIVSNGLEEEGRRETISRLYKISLGIVIVLSFLLLAGSGILKDVFKFQSVFPFFSLALLLLIGVPFTFRNFYLQGIHDFKAVSWSGIITSGGRLFFAVVFVSLGWAVLGAITGLVVASLLALWFVFAKTKDKFKLTLDTPEKSKRSLASELKYGALIFFVTGFVAFLYTADVLVVKHYFSPHAAGLYSGIATIARIIFFVTGSVAGVLLPSIKLKNSFSQNTKILRKALILIVLIGGGALLVFALFPELVTKILIGDRYVVYAFLLPKLSLVLFLVSLINLLFFYFLALRRYFLIFIALIGTISIAIISFLWHSTVSQVINNFLVGSLVTLALIFLFYVINYPKNKFQRNE